METVSKLHYLNLGQGGKFKSGGATSSTAADVDAMFQHLSTAQHKKLILHFHGGLVSEENGLKIARKMADNYQAVGHAYTFVWETGLVETLLSSFDKIQETGLFQELKKIVVRKVCEKLGIEETGARGVAPIDAARVEQELQEPQPFERMEARARGGAEKLEESKLPMLEREIEAELEEELDGRADLQTMLQPGSPDGQRGIAMAFLANLARIVIRVIRRYIRKREHGLLATTVEEILREFYVAEIGTLIWDGMKEKARNGMWMPNTGLQNDERHGGYYFLEKLNAFLGANPGWTVDLVGHSAGSIAICHLLKAANEHGFEHIRARWILLLAPACRTKLFYEQVVRHPERFDHLRMFTMTDDCEQTDHLASLAYPRSLLYLVSGILETGKYPDETDDAEGDGDYFVLGLMRQFSDRPFYQKSEVLQEVKRFFETGDRLVLSPCDPVSPIQGAFCRSEKHGNFDNDEPTLASLAFLLSQ
ncbi:MAG: hypothetical protein U0U46_06950 [Saprospiraceae bacterium]